MARNMSLEREPRRGFATKISTLFYLTKFFGIVPFDLIVYQQHRIFKSSILGNIFSIANVAFYIIAYHLISEYMYFGENNKDAGTLTHIIGIFIMYLEPIMMIVDVTALLINQHYFISCVERIEKVDERLQQAHITIDYKYIERLSKILIIITVSGLMIMISLNFLIFPINSAIWPAVFLPIFISTLSKVWFVVFVECIRLKFVAINNHLENLRTLLTNNKKRMSNNTDTTNRSQALWRQGAHMNRNGHLAFVAHNFGQLNEEFAPKQFVQRLIEAATERPNHKINYIKPASSNRRGNNGNQFYDTVVASTTYPMVNFTRPRNALVDPSNIDNKLDSKLSMLCFVHDEICEIAKMVNYMFSFQMLILMAYGFMSITAQLYFVYCGLVGQTIPALFRSAESLTISAFFLCFTASECVYVIYNSWQTKIACQKTGVQIHKVANIVDEDHIYQAVNHLSLKLLNHQIDFTACGFFDMDMTTIYAISGAITSYLIILIQFNVAAQRSKKPTNTTEIYANTSMTTLAF